VKCKHCGSTRWHNTLLGCANYWKSLYAAERAKVGRRREEIARLKAELKVAENPGPRESTDLLRVVQAMEHRVQVLESEFRAMREHRLRPLGPNPPNSPALSAQIEE